jgi:hypothetical protein
MTYPYENYADPKKRPDWMSDTPVDVDVHSLETFSKIVKAEVATNVVPGSKAIQAHLAGAGSHIAKSGEGDGAVNTYQLGNNRTFGVDPRFAWASLAGYRHMEAEATVAELLTNLSRGLNAVASAAEQIAADYSSADARNAMDVSKVSTYFAQETPTTPSAPPSGQDSRNANKAL